MKTSHSQRLFSKNSDNMTNVHQAVGRRMCLVICLIDREYDANHPAGPGEITSLYRYLYLYWQRIWCQSTCWSRWDNISFLHPGTKKTQKKKTNNTRWCRSPWSRLENIAFLDRTWVECHSLKWWHILVVLSCHVITCHVHVQCLKRDPQKNLLTKLGGCNSQDCWIDWKLDRLAG